MNLTRIKISPLAITSPHVTIKIGRRAAQDGQGKEILRKGYRTGVSLKIGRFLAFMEGV